MKFITCLAIGGTFLCFHHFIPSPYEQIFDLKWLAIVENKRSNVRVFGFLFLGVVFFFFFFLLYFCCCCFWVLSCIVLALAISQHKALKCCIIVGQTF